MAWDAWGKAAYNQTDTQPGGDTYLFLPPAAMASGLAFDAISAGDFFALGRVGSSLYHWGNNENAQRGDGTRDSDPHAPQLITALPAIVGHSAGYAHGLAWTAGGDLYAWGSKEDIGVGTTVGWQTTPTVVLSDVAFAVAGHSTSMAVRNDGTLWFTGLLFDYLSGDGRGNVVGAYETSWIQVSGAPSGIAEVALGDDEVIVRTSAGACWGWGRNAAGALANGSTGVVSTPTDLSLSADALAPVFRGFYWLIGSSVYFSGDNSTGCLGDGTTTGNISTRTEVSSLTALGSVAWMRTARFEPQAGLFRLGDGSTYGLGAHGAGLFGDETELDGGWGVGAINEDAYASTPLRLASLDGYSDLAAGDWAGYGLAGAAPSRARSWAAIVG